MSLIVTVDESESEDTDSSDSSSDDENKTKTKKTKSTKSNNYFGTLHKKTSDMSKAVRKQLKSIQRKYRTYIGMKIYIPANENAMVTLKKQMGLLFAQLQSIDSKTIIYGFKDDYPTHALREPKDVPDNIMTFREFIIGASLREEEGFTWATTWIGHDKPISDLFTNMKYWSKLKRSLIFEKALQVKYSVRDYFLSWSHGKMDKKTLHTAMTAAIKSFTKTKYEFAFTWTALKGCNGNFLRLAKKEKQWQHYCEILTH